MPRRQRDLLLEALQRPAAVTAVPPSPALGFVSGFVPTLISLQQQERMAEREAQLEAQKQLARLLAEREKRQVILSTPMAQLLQTAARRYLGVEPTITPGLTVRPEELTTMTRLIGYGLQQQIWEQRLQQEMALEELDRSAKDKLQQAKNVNELRQMLRQEAATLNTMLRRLDTKNINVGLTPEEQREYYRLQNHLVGIRQMLAQLANIEDKDFQEIKKEPEGFLERVKSAVRSLFPGTAILFPPQQPQVVPIPTPVPTPTPTTPVPEVPQERLEEIYREFFEESE